MTDNEARTPELERRTVGLLAAAAGLFVASIYYNQPMLGILAREFGTDAAGISSVAVLTQVGYAVGLLLLAPLGDRFERRGLIALTSVALALALALAAAAPSLGFLAVSSLGVGLLATVAQQVVPMAAQLAPDRARGRVVGTVMAGLLTGILLARTVSGVVSQYASWRIMFGLSAAACLAMGVVLGLRLPKVPPVTRESYPRLMLSLVKLLRSHGTLGRSGVVQGLLFAAFIAFWANLALFLEEPPLSAGSTIAGLLGLFGVAGVMAAPLAGKLADKGGQGRVIVCGTAAVAASFAVYWYLRASWIALIAGIVLMDIGMQAAMISNQTRVYALDAAARSRLNTVYMTIMFVFGALGAAAGGQAFARWGWGGVCLFGGACATLALAVELRARRA